MKPAKQSGGRAKHPGGCAEESDVIAPQRVPQLLGREVALTRRETARQNGPLLARSLLRIRCDFPQQPQCDLISASLGTVTGDPQFPEVDREIFYDSKR